MHMLTDPVVAWIGLSSIPGVGRATFRKLTERFGSPEAALAAPKSELSVAGISGKTADSISSFPWREQAEEEYRKARELGVAIVTESDPAYPAALRRVPDAPLFLYVRGSFTVSDGRAVAIVGTRKPTSSGRTVANRMARDLAAAGVTVVSGMARGIDTEAHRGALAGGGRTIAVLGSGVDVAYPPENRDLLEEIVRSGAVVSENPLGTRPEAGYFPGRNRIISGLSRGAVIIEASEDSGSLITAKYALEQGRRLFAVPGNIGSPVSKGANGLIKQGAALVEGAADVLGSLGVPAGRRQDVPRPLPPLTDEETRVLKCLGTEPLHIDRLMAEAGTTPARISGILLQLELKQLARQLPGKQYILKEEA